jgi:hypothetical protein
MLSMSLFVRQRLTLVIVFGTRDRQQCGGPDIKGLGLGETSGAWRCALESLGSGEAKGLQ